MTDVGTQQIRRKPILNGLINEYTHAAWRTEDLQVTQPNPIFERDRIELRPPGSTPPSSLAGIQILRTAIQACPHERDLRSACAGTCAERYSTGC